jgi:hypothetical protein
MTMIYSTQHERGLKIWLDSLPSQSTDLVFVNHGFKVHLYLPEVMRIEQKKMNIGN